MKYISSRGNYKPVLSSEAVLQGMVPKGGLFMPEDQVKLDIHDLFGEDYRTIALIVLNKFLTGKRKEFSESQLQQAVEKAYRYPVFPVKDTVPLRPLNQRLAVLELWHGPTAAFKDLALQILPELMNSAARNLGKKEKRVILVATSGDTGKAALEGFKDAENTEIIVFYPKNGVSRLQEMQMQTTEGNNTHVVGVKGNFDDCQTMVKEIFSDAAFNKELKKKKTVLSSANSINWGRLVPQIVYYIHSYFYYVDRNEIFLGDPVNFCVPTGNFGNILAAYYASKLGLPIKKLICASNENHILTDFINTGVYDISGREFYQTTSPSMDILISSNLERFLAEMTGRKFGKIRKWYQDLKENKKFEIDSGTQTEIQKQFYGGFADWTRASKTMKDTWEKDRYLMDPHTAVGMTVYQDYQEKTADQTPAVICSTASPYKFSRTVYEALYGKPDSDDEISLLYELEKKILSKSNEFPMHNALKDIEKKEIRHQKVIQTDEGAETVLKILNLL